MTASRRDMILSLSALATAVLSICVTVWLGMETRHHNRLSVRPRLDITFNAGSHSLGYEVVNHGLGPALVTSVRVQVDGREQTGDGPRGYGDLLRVVGAVPQDLVMDAFGAGSMLPAGEARRLFAVRMDGPAGRDSLIRAVYGRTAVEIRYQSMYGEDFRSALP